MTFLKSRRNFLVLGCMIPLAACASQFQTAYTPVSGAAQKYRVTKINVVVPSTLTVSESEAVFMPNADIVWREEPAGDRYTQVKKIFEEAAAGAVKGMKGKEAVILNITVERFHAINFKTLDFSPTGKGVGDIRFTAELVDAKTGKVVVPAQKISADFILVAGKAAQEELAKGITQRTKSIAQIDKTLSGWLGTGPTNFETFKTIGA